MFANLLKCRYIMSAALTLEKTYHVHAKIHAELWHNVCKQEMCRHIMAAIKNVPLFFFKSRNILFVAFRFCQG